MKLVLTAAVHELRTPLNAASGWLQVLEKSGNAIGSTPDRAIKGMTDAIEEQTQQLATLLELPINESERVASNSTVALITPMQESLNRLRSDQRPTISDLSALSDVSSINHPDLFQTCDLLLRICKIVFADEAIHVSTASPVGFRVEASHVVNEPVYEILGGRGSLSALSQQSRILLICWRFTLFAHALSWRLSTPAKNVLAVEWSD